MKRSHELECLGDLGLPAYVVSYVRNNISSNPEEIVYYGRRVAFNLKDYSVIEKKSVRLLVEALDREGFIRHDFGLKRLYMARLVNAVTSELPYDFFDDDYAKGNRTYETYEDVSDERFESFKAFIKSFLKDQEYELIALRYGLDGTPRTLNQCAEKIGVTREQARLLELKAIRRLIHCGAAHCLKLFLASDSEIRRKVANLKRALKNIEECGLLDTLSD